MSVVVLDTNLVPVGIVDTYESFIWTERYYAYGDFEIYMPATKEALDLLKLDRYISIPSSNRLMIIESRHIVANVESGDYLTVAGRSLESILTRRVIWDEVSFSGNLQDAIHTLLNNNIISPRMGDRRIDNFIFQASTDSRITSLAINAKYCGDSLYTILTELCDNYKIGFKIELNSNNQFVFSLYKGNDRSYSQTTYPYVVFSKQYENIISSDYSEDSTELKNVALVGGEIIENEARKFTSTGEGTGLNRREVFVDASSISSKDGDTPLSDTVYQHKLRNKGMEELVNHAQVTDIDAEVDFSVMYVADRDYFLGDEVQVIDEYNIDTRARVTEYLVSYSDTGTAVRPTFSIEENYKLPAEYQEVEYLSSTGTQYINTSIIPSRGMVAEVVFRFEESPATEQQIFSYYREGAPVYSNNSTYELGAYVYHDNVYYRCTTAIEEPEEWTPSHWTEDTPKYRWQCGGINNTVYTTGYFAYSQTNPTLWTTGYGNYEMDEDGASMYLFAQDLYETNAAQGIGGKKQVKSVIVRQNGSSISHLIPCYRIIDGKPGMYDLVRNIFLTNIGTGEFGVGPNVGNLSTPEYNDFVPAEYQKVDYIQSDGHSYINTGLVTRSLGDRISYDGHFYTPSYSENYMFGAQQYTGNWLYGALFTSLSNAQIEYNGAAINYSLANDIVFEQSVEGGTFTSTLNGVTNTATVGTNQETNTLLIFACWNTSGQVRYYEAPMRLYYLEVKNGDNLVAFYQPVYRRSDGKIGVYELTSGKFIEANGNVSKGPDELPMFLGPYDVTPEFNNITLNTKNYNMSDDITVREIPKNTGRVSQDDDTLKIT